MEPILPGDLVRQLVRGCGGAGLPLHQHVELVGDHLLGGGGVRGPAQAVQEEREEGEAGGGRPPVKERERGLLTRRVLKLSFESTCVSCLSRHRHGFFWGCSSTSQVEEFPQAQRKKFFPPLVQGGCGCCGEGASRCRRSCRSGSDLLSTMQRRLEGTLPVGCRAASPADFLAVWCGCW